MKKRSAQKKIQDLKNQRTLMKERRKSFVQRKTLDNSILQKHLSVIQTQSGLLGFNGDQSSEDEVDHHHNDNQEDDPYFNTNSNVAENIPVNNILLTSSVVNNHINNNDDTTQIKLIEQSNLTMIDTSTLGNQANNSTIDKPISFTNQ